MNQPVIVDRLPEVSPSSKARIAAGFYLVTFVFGIASMMFARRGLTGYRYAADMVADAAYVGVTFFFYELFKAVNERIAMIAAFFSLAGCVAGALAVLHIIEFPLNALVFFGVYCLLTGYLIVRSTFLPRILGPLLMLAGAGWLTYLAPRLASSITAYVMTTGIVGEGALMLRLLFAGVNDEQWRKQARS